MPLRTCGECKVPGRSSILGGWQLIHGGDSGGLPVGCCCCCGAATSDVGQHLKQHSREDTLGVHLECHLGVVHLLKDGGGILVEGGAEGG
eukprot:5644891-Ditylum_brightwellii.AAC.1